MRLSISIRLSGEPSYFYDKPMQAFCSNLALLYTSCLAVNCEMPCGRDSLPWFNMPNVIVNSWCNSPLFSKAIALGWGVCTGDACCCSGLHSKGCAVWCCVDGVCGVPGMAATGVPPAVVGAVKDRNVKAVLVTDGFGMVDVMVKDETNNND